MAELKVLEFTPGNVLFNYEELKAEIEEKAKVYETIKYTDATIKEAKEDKAKLNKLKTALNDERIRREKLYMEPFQVFKKQVDEIIGIIDKPVKIIDAQVKEFENAEKERKHTECVNIWHQKKEFGNVPEWLRYEQIENEKWANKTFKLAQVEEEITSRIARILADVQALENLPEFGFEALETYKKTLDLATAMQEGQRLADIQKRKEEAKRLADERAAALRAAETTEPITEKPVAPMPEPTPAPVQQTAPAAKWVNFSALLTTEKAFALRDFFVTNGIEFKKIN